MVSRFHDEPLLSRLKGYRDNDLDPGYPPKWEVLPETHNSPETAYIQADYPYGRRDRCQRRVWVEVINKKTSKRYKQMRFVYQTQNPKTGRWNAHKPSTYYDFVVMVRDTTTDWVTQVALKVNDSDETFEDFESELQHLLSDWQLEQLQDRRKTQIHVGRVYRAMVERNKAKTQTQN